MSENEVPMWTAEVVELPPGTRENLLGRLLDMAVSARALEQAPTLSDLHDQFLGHGVVLSHTRCDGIEDVRIVVGLLKRPVYFGGAGETRAIVCALIPRSKSREYLSWLARLSRRLADPEVEAALRSADPGRVRTMLSLSERPGGPA